MAVAVCRTAQSLVFLAEIAGIKHFIRLRFLVRDKTGAKVPVAFHTDDYGFGLRTEAKLEYTVAILYPYQHEFLDFTVGIRQEDEELTDIF